MDKKEELRTQSFTEMNALKAEFDKHINEYLDKDNGMNWGHRMLVVSRAINALFVSWMFHMNSNYETRQKELDEKVAP